MSQDQASKLVDPQPGPGLLPDHDTYTVNEGDVFIIWPSAQVWLTANTAELVPGTTSTVAISPSHHDTYTTYENGVYVVWPNAKAWHLANAASTVSKAAAIPASSAPVTDAKGFHMPATSSAELEHADNPSSSATTDNMPPPPQRPSTTPTTDPLKSANHTVPTSPFHAFYFANYNHSLTIALNLAIKTYGSFLSLGDFYSRVDTDFATSTFFLKEGLNLVTIALGARVRPGTQLTDDRVIRQLRQEAHTCAPEGMLPEIHVQNAMKVMAAGRDDPIAALSMLVWEFFAEGENTASYAWCMLETTVLEGVLDVDRYFSAAPSWFWGCVANWEKPLVAACLVMVLASPPEGVEAVMWKMGRNFGGGGEAGLEEMRCLPSESLSEAVGLARSIARVRGAVSVLGVHLCDVGFEALKMEGKGEEVRYVTFEHWFVIGICEGGIQVWQAGGQDAEGYSLIEHYQATGAELVGWAKADEFVAAFEGFAVAKGSWNRRSLKQYKLCFGIDLRTKQQTKILPKDYEAWVEVVKIENVTRENLVKFKWN